MLYVVMLTHPPPLKTDFFINLPPFRGQLSTPHPIFSHPGTPPPCIPLTLPTPPPVPQNLRFTTELTTPHALQVSFFLQFPNSNQYAGIYVHTSSKSSIAEPSRGSVVLALSGMALLHTRCGLRARHTLHLLRRLARHGPAMHTLWPLASCLETHDVRVSDNEARRLASHVLPCLARRTYQLAAMPCYAWPRA